MYQLTNITSILRATDGACIEWEYATEIHRNSPLVQSLATSLGLTEESMDSLFNQAAKL